MEVTINIKFYDSKVKSEKIIALCENMQEVIFLLDRIKNKHKYDDMSVIIENVFTNKKIIIEKWELI